MSDLDATVRAAKAAAGDKNVLVHGAAIAQRALGAGLLDEMEIHLVPVLLGEGRRLFEHLGFSSASWSGSGSAPARAGSPTSATASAVDAGRPARTASRRNARAGVESGRGAASYCTRPPTGRSANPSKETTMPQYMLLMYQPSDGVPRDSEGQPLTTPEGWAAEREKWASFSKDLAEAGLLVANSGLQGTDAATTVRVRDGETQITDGPFAETKEYLAGYFLIEAEDLDAALGWAARIPSSRWGSTEVRPLRV
jgi:hypothetical protein